MNNNSSTTAVNIRVVIHTHSVENEKFSLTEKKFRQINYLVISLIKQLLTQNFFVNIEREFLEFPH